MPRLAWMLALPFCRSGDLEANICWGLCVAEFTSILNWNLVNLDRLPSGNTAKHGTDAAELLCKRGSLLAFQVQAVALLTEAKRNPCDGRRVNQLQRYK